MLLLNSLLINEEELVTENLLFIYAEAKWEAMYWKLTNILLFQEAKSASIMKSFSKLVPQVSGMMQFPNPAWQIVLDMWFMDKPSHLTTFLAWGIDIAVLISRSPQCSRSDEARCWHHPAAQWVLQSDYNTVLYNYKEITILTKWLQYSLVYNYKERFV